MIEDRAIPPSGCPIVGRVDWPALGRTLLACTCFALIYPLVGWSRTGWISAAVFFREFAAAEIYGICIGTLANLVPWKSLQTRLASSAALQWLANLSVLGALAVLGTTITGLIFIPIGWVHDYGLFFVENLPMVTVVTLLVGTAILLYESMRDRLANATLEIRTKELERERALKLATEARLSSLESRLHPHFLFNTLNSISSLIPEDPQRAEKLVEQMAALLRFSLNSSRSGVVPLEQELKIVNDYLEIEKARLGDRLKYEVSAPRELDAVTVPPLAIQTLVENSIKHVIAPDRMGGWLKVTVERSNGALSLDVCDSGPGFDLIESHAGHGIDNLRSRLAALYGNGASMTSTRRNGEAAVQLRIPVG